MIQVTNIDHLNFYVRNLEESKSFYKRLFGMESFEEGVSSSGNLYSIIGISKKIFLCLYEGAKKINEKKFNHFGVHVENFDQTLEAIKENNIKILYGGQIHHQNSRSLYVSDPDGNEIELSENFGGGL